MPRKENATFEFKSSATSDGKLSSLIQKAASGFWNSGGGFFAAGVDDATGFVDGGISTLVGRTSRKDWIDRVVSQVSPQFPGGYVVAGTEEERRKEVKSSESNQIHGSVVAA